jgi:hypothetical protein
VARTGLGPLGFDDPMEVTAWQPPTDRAPGRCEVRKHGRVVLGTATFEVEPLGPHRCAVTWTEQVEVTGLRRVPGAGWLTRVSGAMVFRTLIRRMALELDREQVREATGGVG